MCRQGVDMSFMREEGVVESRAEWTPTIPKSCFCHCIASDTSVSPSLSLSALAFCRISAIKAPFVPHTHNKPSHHHHHPLPTVKGGGTVNPDVLLALTHTNTHTRGRQHLAPAGVVHSRHSADKPVPEFTGVQGFDLELISYLDNASVGVWLVWGRGVFTYLYF